MSPFLRTTWSFFLILRDCTNLVPCSFNGAQGDASTFGSKETVVSPPASLLPGLAVRALFLRQCYSVQVLVRKVA